MGRIVAQNWGRGYKSRWREPPAVVSGGSASFRPRDGAIKFVRADRRAFLRGRSRGAGQAIKPSVGRRTRLSVTGRIW